MSQSFLGPNPGTVVADALAPKLMETENVTNTTVDGSWIDVGFPGECVVVLELGAMAALSNLRVEIQGADDDQGNGLVSFGAFDSIDQDDDNEVRIMDIQCYKRYVRASATESGNAQATINLISLAPPQFKMGSTRTA